jgi:hypothetical protein
MYDRHRNEEMSANFSIKIPQPHPGWDRLRHGPQTLFLYGDRKKGLLLRGSVNQMIDDVNPTPDLDRDGLAKTVVENTHDNMKGWSAEVQDKVDSPSASFRIVRRSEKDHTVVTAFCVKGNTTLLVSLSGRAGYAEQVDKDMPEFRKFLSEVVLTKTDMSKW